MLGAFAIGRYPVGPAELAPSCGRRSPAPRTAFRRRSRPVIFGVRGPRVLAALAIGAALAVAGAAYQALFRNPLVAPDILGVSAGAAVGAVLGIFLSQPVVIIQALAFGGGLAAVALVYVIASAVRGHDPLLVLVLAGVVIGALGGAVIALVKYLADPYNQLPAITFWLLGSLASTTPADLASAVPAIVVGCDPAGAAALARQRARARRRGSALARRQRDRGAGRGHRGRDADDGSRRVDLRHRRLDRPAHPASRAAPRRARTSRALLPISVALGAAFLLAVDTLARTIARIEIPLGVLTAFVGTPLFLWQLIVARRSWQ